MEAIIEDDSTVETRWRYILRYMQVGQHRMKILMDAKSKCRHCCFWTRWWYILIYKQVGRHRMKILIDAKSKCRYCCFFWEIDSIFLVYLSRWGWWGSSWSKILKDTKTYCRHCFWGGGGRIICHMFLDTCKQVGLVGVILDWKYLKIPSQNVVIAFFLGGGIQFAVYFLILVHAIIVLINYFGTEDSLQSTSVLI